MFLRWSSDAPPTTFRYSSGAHPETIRCPSDDLRVAIRSPALHPGPDGAAPMALEHGVDDARGMIPVFEAGEGGRPVSGPLRAGDDDPVHVAHHVAERVGPALLVTAGQMRI